MRSNKGLSLKQTVGGKDLGTTKKPPFLEVMMKLNTGVPNGEWIVVRGYNIPDLVQNCINATYCPDDEGFLEVLEVKEEEGSG